MAWHAQGYTEFDKAKRPGGKDAYDGTLPQLSAEESTVALGCNAGLITSAQWAGGSGSAAFDKNTSRTALAVISEYQGGKNLDQLVAVPLCYLLNSAKTKDGFRRAIQFDAYQRRKEYRDDVKNVVASKLNALSTEALKQVAQEINALTKIETSKINERQRATSGLASPRRPPCSTRHTFGDAIPSTAAHDDRCTERG